MVWLYQGEQPLAKDFSCNLGSINLAEFVKNEYTEDATIKWSELKDAIHTGIYALDKIVDDNLPNHPLEVHRQNAKNYRNLGLGCMGLGTMFFKLGIKYGSIESKEIVEKLFRFFFREAVFASNNLAKEYGVFPKYSPIVFDSRIIKNHFSEKEIEILKEYGLRNCSLLSIAPAGTISLIFGVTSGIEPEFAIKYTRKTHNLNESYDVYCKEAQYYMNKFNTKDLPSQFVCSADIHWSDRVEIQGIMQKSIDTAISSTVNLPKETTIEEIEKLYLKAWQYGLKGITIFRDGCRRSGILTTQKGSSVEKNDKKDQSYSTLTPQSVEKNTNKSVISKEDGEFTVGFPRGMIERVPKGLDYRKYKLKTGCGSLYLFVGLDEDKGKIYDVFTNTDGVGGCPINTQAVSRLISACMRGGVPIEYIVEQLNKSGTCPSFQFQRGKGEKLSNGKSCPSAIGCVLRDILKELKDLENEDEANMQTETSNEVKVEYIKMVEEPSKEIKNIANGDGCPECGGEIRHEGGCLTCPNCGWSKCN